MVGLADENGREYKCKYGTYSKEKGFCLNDYATRRCAIKTLLDELFHENLWSLVQPEKEMTLKDIERELGYRIRIVDPEPEKKVISEKRKKEIDETVNMFRRMLGIDLDPEDYY